VPALNPARAEPTTASRTTQTSTTAQAEMGLQRSPYSALHDVSCDCQDGVLVLRGCLPSYYLKQVAQEIVAHSGGGQGD
jgi:hypothetical protein